VSAAPVEAPDALASDPAIAAVIEETRAKTRDGRYMVAALQAAKAK